jgi:hypothetical protein
VERTAHGINRIISRHRWHLEAAELAGVTLQIPARQLRVSVIP